jgi:NADH-quinone oxidoreductase subunit F
MPTAEVVLAQEPVVDIDDYVDRGGGAGYQMARAMRTDGVLAELRHSGLRGRGGAGFPVARKWESVLSAQGTTKYVVGNAAEGEPGTFKDRAIIRANPYQVIEGLAIAAWCLGCGEVFVAVKTSFERERSALVRAAHELLDADLIGDLTITVACGPEEYLFGEEKALLEVIEGRDPQPRQLPPYVHGLYATAPQLGWHSHEPESGHGRGEESNPTLVGNIETFANVTHIIAQGADSYRTFGTGAEPGTVVATVVGDVAIPRTVEIELGTTMRELIDLAGGVASGHRVKAVFSGVTNPLLEGDRLDVALTHAAMAAAGSGLGAAGFIVYDNSACMVEVAEQFSRFLWVESCGQCTACKLGCGRVTGALDRLRGAAASELDLLQIRRGLAAVADGNRCFLPVEEQQVIGSILRAFPEDFVAHLEGGCPSPRDLVFPKIVDLEDGTVTYDTHQVHKRPDWTFAA